MPITTYHIRWNPDSRWNYGHWDLVDKSVTITRYCHNYISDALVHPLNMKAKYPDKINIVLPDAQTIESARKYYGSILEEMFNVTEGEFIGC